MPLTPRRAGTELPKTPAAAALREALPLRAAENLKRLHELRTAPYASVDEMLATYLEAGCEMFRCIAGMLWTRQGEEGTVRAVYDPGRLLGAGPAAEFASRCAGGAGLRTRRQQFIGAPIREQNIRGALVFLPAPGASATANDRDVLALMAQATGRALLDYETEYERARTHAVEKSWNAILQNIAENKTLESILTAIASLVEQQAPGSACSISATASDGAAIRVAPGLPAKYRLTPALKLRSEEMAFASEPRWCGSVARDPVWRDLAGLLHETGFHGCLWMPLSAAGATGVIALYYPAGTSSAGSQCELLARAARTASIAIDHAETAARLHFDARHDRLTGLPNRFHFLSLLERALADARERRNTLALLFIDLDRFKQINDTLGHSMGDAVLKEVAVRLKSLLEPGDLAARMAGDEFTIALTRVRDESDALAAGQTVLEALREPYRVDGYELFLTASMGLSVFPQHGEDASALLRRADFAMYRAKSEGGSHIEPFLSEPDRRGLEQFELENSLRRAVDNRELLLSYQPVVDIGGTLEGLEALLAWKHPKLGRLAPKQFIPLAEESGLIVPIGSWVTAQACRTAARWRESGLRPVRVSVNVSALQFARSDFVETIAATLAATHFPPECLELELTETFVLRDIDESARRMGRIRDLGVSLAIDDFGTGYSSLSYLRRLPATSVKIDQGFIRDLTGPAGSPAILGSLVLLAHSMGLAVVAEGVETQAELELVRRAGCDKVQGHLFGEALSARAAARLLSRADPRMPIIRR